MEDVKGDTPTADELLTAAIGYAEQGLKIYPVLIAGLKPDGKKDVRVPVRWSEQATDDLAQVKEWWGERFRGYGIGVDMGRSGLAVADADVKNDVDGIRRLAEELEDVYTGESYVSRTPSNGAHVWYRDPAATCGSGSNTFGTKDEPSGIDVRGVGGTIFMPPTFVPGYGRYEWAGGQAPDFAALPEVPARLAAACPPGGLKSKPSSSSTTLSSSEPVMETPAGESQLFARPVVATDRTVTREQAMAQIKPLWDEVRDTKSPNGLWQAVASFARAAAHFQCFWDRDWVERAVLQAYAEGGHGYAALDDGDLRAIETAYALQEQARADGDLDEGWLAQPAALPADPPASDEVDALLAEMLTAAEVAEIPPPHYLIKGLINFDSEVWLIGPPGSRKSFVALDMAGHIASGTPWQGFAVNQASVVIIAAEGRGGLGSRIKAYTMQHGPMPPSVRILRRPVQAADPRAWAVLVEACRRLEPGLVILDTQARVTVGLKENDATDMGIFVNAVAAIRMATGAAVMPVHHTGRNGGDARGSSALDGAQDTELKVVAAGTALRGQLLTEKQKDLPEAAPIELCFRVHQVGVDEDGEPITSLALLTPDAWRGAEVDPEELDAGQEVRVPEPEPWTWVLADHNTQHNIRRVLQVLATVGGVGGLTKAECCRVVRERWYGGRPLKKSRRTGHLDNATWDRSWDAAVHMETSAGEPVVVRPEDGSARFAASPVAIAQLSQMSQ